MDDCRFSLSDSVIFADTIKSVVPIATHGFWGKSSRLLDERHTQTGCGVAHEFRTVAELANALLSA